MRRPLVLLVPLAFALGLLGLVACGGDDKPPLTPDQVMEPPAEEAGAPGAPSTTPLAKPK